MTAEASFRLSEWLKLRKVSRSQEHRLRKLGQGPRLHFVGNSPRVSPEADRDWVLEREAEAAAKSGGDK